MRARLLVGSVAAAAVLAALATLGGCADPRYCDAQTQCRDAAYPYCQLTRRECQAAPLDGGVDAAGDAGHVDAQSDVLPVPDGGCPAPLRECAGACYTLDDPQHCGASCTVCAPPAHATATCDGTSCDFTCDGAYWRDGVTCAACDTAAHCGAACAACGGTTPSCQGGTTGRCVCTTASCGGMKPVCDTGSGTCRGCAAHAECPSGACDPGGACVPETEVIYLGVTGCSDSTAGSKAQPFCTFPVALAAALAGPRFHIVAAAGTYSYNGAQVVQDKKVVLIGAASATTPTELVQNQNNVPVLQLLQVSGAAELSLYGVTLRGGTSNSGHGVQCSGTSTPAVLAVRASVLGPNAARGITATQCAVTVERSVIKGNFGGGLALTSSSYAVESCLIVENGKSDPSGSDIGGVSLISPGTPARFVNNTVASNGVKGGLTAGGVWCVGGGTVVNAIVWNNAVAQLRDCAATYSDVQGSAGGTGNLNADPLFVDSGAGNYHLSTSPTPSPCINAGTASGAPALDLEGHPRTGNPDLGCYEAP